MRALFTCVDAYGHLNPLLPSARALAEAGHEVAIATGPAMLPRAEAAGFAARQAGLGIGVAFDKLAEHYPGREYDRLAPSEIIDWYLPHLFGEILAPAMLDDLEPLMQSWQPDVILHDTWEFAGPVAAARGGVPSICHTLGPRFTDRVVEAVAAGVAPLWRQRGLDPDPTAGLYRHLCLDITPPSLQPSQQQVRSRNTVQLLRPVAQLPLQGEELPLWMESRREVPLAYMTLGTNTNTDIDMFRSVIEGLGGLEIDVLITLGHGKDIAWVGTTPDNIHVESYVPQSLLLPHCSVVICHGGAGTTFNALALGLPLLVLPQGADQYIISGLVQGAGAGTLLIPQNVNPSSIRANVLALLSEPSFVAAAHRLQSEIAGMPSPDEAVRLIEATVCESLIRC